MPKIMVQLMHRMTVVSLLGSNILLNIISSKFGIYIRRRTDRCPLNRLIVRGGGFRGWRHRKLFRGLLRCHDRSLLQDCPPMHTVTMTMDNDVIMNFNFCALYTVYIIAQYNDTYYEYILCTHKYYSQFCEFPESLKIHFILSTCIVTV